MPLHKKLKIEAVIEVPEGHETVSPHGLLYPGAYVTIHSMETLEISDIVIQPKVDEKQRQMNEYKRVIQAAIDQTPWKQLKMKGHKRWNEGRIEIGLPSIWRNFYAIVTFNCEQTTITRQTWKDGNKHIAKFELGRPDVLNELASYINNEVAAFKASKEGEHVKWEVDPK